MAVHPALAHVPTAAEVAADRQGKPLWKSPITRLDAKTAADKDDAKLLDQWRKAVRFRDRGRCRCCGVKTVTTIDRDPKRGEAHHIVTRADAAVRTDPRNGLWLCLSCHQRLQGRGRRLHVVGKASQLFTAANGKSYLDATYALTFTEAKP